MRIGWLAWMASACVWISESHHADAIDADGDGRSAFEECDDDDPDRIDGPGVLFADIDGDGFGAGEERFGCLAPGLVSNADDCDDHDSNIHPLGAERCDALDRDEDCDGAADDDDPQGAIGQVSLYADDDGDGVGDRSIGQACDATTGTSTVGGDCNDAAPGVHPGVIERCNGIDDDCDDVVDEPGAQGELAWFIDTDGDGYGSPAAWVMACTAPPGYADNADDCDDGRSWVNPDAPERCDASALDEDCDGGADDDDPDDAGAAWPDVDGDGYGDADAEPVDTCALGLVLNNADCDDGDSDIWPGFGCPEVP